MSWIKKVRELMQKTGKSMKEVFAMIPGSMTHYRNEIRQLLKTSPPAFLGAHKYSYIEDILVDKPNQVVIECVDTDFERKYYLAELKDESGALSWGEGKEIEFSVVPAMKNEMAEMVKFVESAGPPSTEFVEISDATFEYNESTQTAVVNIAQRAEMINRNQRSYPKDVLQRAVKESQEYIEKHGSIPIETLHGDVRDINSVCAVIKKIEFDESTGVVSLPDVRILSETTSGKNVLAILKAGEKLQVSQRGRGTSHQETDESTGKTYQKMDFITFDGFDLVWNGEASVANTDFTLTKVPESLGNAPTLENVTAILEQAGKGEVDTAKLQEAIKGVIGTELAPMQAQLESALKVLKEKEESVARSDFMRQGVDHINTQLAEMPRFSDNQKELIRARVDLTKLAEGYDGTDPSAVSRIIADPLAREVKDMDSLIAEMGVDGLNLPRRGPDGSRIINRYGGVTMERVLTDMPYDGDTFVKTAEAAIRRITRQQIKEQDASEDDIWVMPKNHEAMDVLSEILDKFCYENSGVIQNEAQQSGVGVPVSITSMYIVYVAWRLTTAFQVCQMHMMENLLENIPVEVWTGAHRASTEPIEMFMAVNPGESTAITESVWSALNYELAAAYQPQHTRVTPYAMAVTKNTVMEPVARSIALPARELRDITDTMLWYLPIMEGLKHDATEVTTAEVASKVGTTNVWKLDGPIVPYEWVVIKDSNKNVTSVGFKKLFPADGAATLTTAQEAGLTLEPLEVEDSSGTALLYKTDYTVDFVKGEIMLTTAGAAKVTGSETVNAKYTRATQMRVWDATPASGVSFANHLLNYQSVLADTKADIVDRHYMPECLCLNYRVKEKLALSARFTSDGSNNAHAIDMMNELIRIQGLKPIWSTAIPLEYQIVQENMATLYGVHTPFTMTTSQITDNTGDERWFAKQFTGGGVPEPDKLQIVGITNLDQL